MPPAVAVDVKPIKLAAAAGALVAPVPPWVSCNVPVVSVARLIAPHVGWPATLPCSTCVEVPSEARDAIAVVVPP